MVDNETTAAAVKDQILSALLKAPNPIKVLSLAQSLGLDKKQVNRCLYDLHKRGKAQYTEGQGPPLWTATVAALTLDNANDNGNMNSFDRQANRVLETLRQHTHGASSYSIALSLQMSSAAINSILYLLQADGEVERVNQSPPAWKVREHAATTAITSNTGSAREGNSEVSGSDVDYDNSAAASRTRKRPALPRQDLPEETKTYRKRPRLSQTLPAAKPKTTTSDESSSDESIADDTVFSISTSPMQLAVDDDASPDDLNKNQDIIKESAWAQTCADLAWKKYRSIYPNAKENDIIASFVLRDSKADPRVIAIGSGTAIAGGDQYSLTGETVHDCHAEVVARRSLIRWLYSQIDTAGKQGSIFQRHPQVSREKDTSTSTGTLPFTIISKNDLDVWLYISRAPCGDGAIFSCKDSTLSSTTKTGKSAGKLRVKMEAGVGSYLVTMKAIQTFDGLGRGDRAYCHSCSDKVAKWNLLGVQGSLLSRLIPPLYIQGIVVGDFFQREHLDRALCSRFRGPLQAKKTLVPSPFRLHRPIILPANTTPRHEKLKKKGNVSVNWNENDSAIELVVTKTGRTSAEDQTVSRISKRSLYSLFSKTAVTATGNHSNSCRLSYRDAKLLAKGYQQAKTALLEAIQPLYGSWLHKPVEVDDFTIAD